MGGFHVASSPACWWTKIIHLLFALFVRQPGPSCSKGGYCYPLDNSIDFAIVYPLDSDLSRR